MRLSQEFNISVVDLPESPYVVAPFSLFPAENTLPGVTLDRSFKYEDQDIDGILLTGVVSGHAMFSMRRSAVQDSDPTHHWLDLFLLPTGWLNFEGPVNAYNVTVNVTDGGFVVSTAVSIFVTNVDEQPSFGTVSFTIAEDDLGFVAPVVVGQG